VAKKATEQENQEKKKISSGNGVHVRKKKGKVVGWVRGVVRVGGMGGGKIFCRILKQKTGVGPGGITSTPYTRQKIRHSINGGGDG